MIVPLSSGLHSTRAFEQRCRRSLPTEYIIARIEQASYTTLDPPADHAQEPQPQWRRGKRDWIEAFGEEPRHKLPEDRQFTGWKCFLTLRGRMCSSIKVAYTADTQHEEERQHSIESARNQENQRWPQAISHDADNCQPNGLKCKRADPVDSADSS
jgi:hypothetical protein